MITLHGTPVDLDAEGFFRDPEQWTPDMAADIARANGIDDPRTLEPGRELAIPRLR